jgi:hypothetical protein
MSKRANLYLGRAGQMAVMAEYLARGWNVAIPEVDVGDDIFVVRDIDGNLSRIQVKTASAQDRKFGYSAKFSVSFPQLRYPLTPELTYVFTVRRNHYWEVFAFADINKLNIVNAVGLPIAIIISNIFAMLYTSRSRRFIKMHQKRAEKAREIFSPELNKINKSIPKIDSNRDIFNRTRLQIYLHVLLITIALLPMFVYMLREF